MSLMDCLSIISFPYPRSLPPKEAKHEAALKLVPPPSAIFKLNERANRIARAPSSAQ